MLFNILYPIKVAEEKKKSPHNTRGSQFTTRNTNTKKYQNSCLQSAMRMNSDGYINKYTNQGQKQQQMNT